MSPLEDSRLVGRVVAERYHVDAVVGHGTTGTVFAVHHVSLGSLAALKVLRPRYLTLEGVRHVVETDGRAAWSVSHPSLCVVFDAGTLPDGAPFFVAERLHGEPLTLRLGFEQFSLAAGVDVTMQLLSALDALHARGVIANDLRPDNLLLTYRRGCRPVLKLLDLGLGRLLPIERLAAQWDTMRAAAAADDPHRGGVLAMPYYLSPERARGETVLTPASDLFVTALLLYEALTGLRPFTGSSFAEIAHQMSQTAPPPIGVLRPDIPIDLEPFFARALSPDPLSRFASAAEMQEDLRATCEGTKRTASVPASAVAPGISIDLSAYATASSADPFSDTTDISRRVDLDPEAQALLDQGAREVLAREAAALEDSQVNTSRRGSPGLDEASAESPLRTVPPPISDGELEQTSQGASIDATLQNEDVQGLIARALEEQLAGSAHAKVEGSTALDAPIVPKRIIGIGAENGIGASVESGGDGRRSAETSSASEEEETATMAVTPELRARIEEMAKAPPPRAVGDVSQRADAPTSSRVPRPRVRTGKKP